MKNTYLRTLACLLVGASLTACAGDDTGDSDTDATTTASTSTSSTSSTTADETTTDSTSSSSTDSSSTSDSTTSTSDPTTSTSDPTTSTSDPTTSTTDTTTDTTGMTTDTTTDGTTGGDGLSFAADVYFDVISPRCGCHVGGTPAGLAMPDSDTAYANLVGVASSQLPKMPRVDPGNPANSYLFHKISGTHVGVGGLGTRMPPPPAMMLDAQAIATISNWISDGAQP